MSGGSYDYAYSKVSDMAQSLSKSDQPIRRAFAAHLQLVADAMHDVEWVDSADMCDGDDVEAIKKALGKDADKLELKQIVVEAERVAKQLNEALKK